MYLTLLMCVILKATIISILATQIPAPRKGLKEPGVLLKGLNDVLEVSPQHEDCVFIVTDQWSSIGDVTDVRAPWGVGLFEITQDGHNNNKTHTQITRIVDQARKVRQVSWSVTVVVVSDDPALLASFAELAFKGRLLVWSTRLLVLTRLPLPQLHPLHKLLSMTNSMLLSLNFNPTLRMTMNQYQPYSIVGKPPQTISKWSEERGIMTKSPTQFYSDKFDQLSERPRLIVSRVVIDTEKTEIIDDPNHPGEKKKIAYNAENELIEAIAKSVNFTIKFVSPPDSHWGYLKDGVWTGMVGMVYRGEADFGLGLFTMTPQRATVVDFTYPVAISYARILSGRKGPEVNLWGFLLPLTTEVWLGILMALAVFFLVMLAPSCLPNSKLTSNRLLSSASNCIRVLLQQDLNEENNWWWWERVVLGVWMLMTLVLTRSYAGNLIALLSVRLIPEPLQSLEDLIDYPVKIMFSIGTAEEQAFKFATGGIKRAVWDQKEREGRIVLISVNQLGSVTPMLLEGNTIQISLDVYQRKRMARQFTKTGKCLFSLGRMRYIPALESMAGAKNNPLVASVSRRVMQATEAGLYDHWQKALFPNLTACLNAPTKLAVTSALSIRNIWGMFILLAGGWIVGFLIFLMESVKRIPIQQIPTLHSLIH